MSGHSKWSTIKRKKGALDAVRGKIFSRISKEIIIAVKESGADQNANSRLRTAVIKAKSENMPNDTIDRAIKKGLGENSGDNYEEISYEGYAKGGVAVLVKCLTDNKNRTTAEVRHVFTKYGGGLGETGCVSYLFERQGIFVYDVLECNAEDVLEIAVENGAKDVQVDEEIIEVITNPEDFLSVAQALEEKQYKALKADVLLIPSSYVSQDNDTTEKVLVLIEKLEELDDVQEVSHNLKTEE